MTGSLKWYRFFDWLLFWCWWMNSGMKIETIFMLFKNEIELSLCNLWSQGLNLRNICLFEIDLESAEEVLNWFQYFYFYFVNYYYYSVCKKKSYVTKARVNGVTDVYICLHVLQLLGTINLCKYNIHMSVIRRY